MTTQEYQEIIAKNIKGLPEETLAEIAHFVLFMKKKILEPKAFEDELWDQVVGVELKTRTHSEGTSLNQVTKKHRMTAHDLLSSDLLGLWKDRIDIDDSETYARQLREKAQYRQD